MSRLVLQLLEACGIRKNLRQYDTETYCPMVEQYWSKMCPNCFKIFIFSEYGTYKPKYFSEGCEKYKYPIVLYHKDGHFNGVNRFFIIAGIITLRILCPMINL